MRGSPYSTASPTGRKRKRGESLPSLTSLLHEHRGGRTATPVSPASRTSSATAAVVATVAELKKNLRARKKKKRIMASLEEERIWMIRIIVILILFMLLIITMVLTLIMAILIGLVFRVISMSSAAPT